MVAPRVGDAELGVEGDPESLTPVVEDDAPGLIPGIQGEGPPVGDEDVTRLAPQAALGADGAQEWGITALTRREGVDPEGQARPSGVGDADGRLGAVVPVAIPSGRGLLAASYEPKNQDNEVTHDCLQG